MLDCAVMLGVDHATAPVAVRERLGRLKKEDLLAALQAHGMDEALVLSTCNRFEIYATAPCAHGAQHLLSKILAGGSEMEAEKFNRHSHIKTGEEALRHGFAVAGSIESMVVGEPQILGQFKQAWQGARDAGCVHGFLDRFCTSAMKVGKRIRTETSIGREAVSVASVAVDAMLAEAGDLREKTVLFIGTGEMIGAAVRHLGNEPVGRKLMMSRTLARAQQAAEDFGGEPVTRDALESSLLQADVVICASGGDEAVITHNTLEALACPRPRVLVDLAVPRDIEAQVAELPNISLIDVDSLNSRTSGARHNRQKAIKRANEIIDEEVNAFANWSESRKRVHMIRHLHTSFEQVRREVLARHPNDAERATEVLLKRILHHPTRAIRNRDDLEEVARAYEMFFPTGCTRGK